MLATEPLRSVRRFRAVVWSVPVRPGIVELEIPVTGTPPSPRKTRGQESVFAPPFVAVKRTSAPPLKACWPRVQLSVSEYWDRGLTVPREVAVEDVKKCSGKIVV